MIKKLKHAKSFRRRHERRALPLHNSSGVFSCTTKKPHKPS